VLAGQESLTDEERGERGDLGHDQGDAGEDDGLADQHGPAAWRGGDAGADLCVAVSGER